MARVSTSHEPTNNVWSDTGVLVDNLRRLMKEKDSCDVVFVVGKSKEHFNAHSLILRVRCGKFHEWKQVQEYRSPVLITEECFRPEVFKKVLEYIYTGKMEFTTADTLETLKIAHNLKIPDLILACEQFLLEQLSVNNCCEFFMDSLSVFTTKDFQGGKVENLVHKCRIFIEENATDVVKTEGFLNLSKDALIQLVASDQFGLPEEEVWYAVLKWSKHQAKVKEPVKNWTEKERKIVCEYLSDVIGYVRILLIDSKIFAEEVEPTGAVPIELSLERYRYAAVPDTFHGGDDNRLKSRVSHTLFQDTTILQKNNVKYQEVLNKWFGNTCQEWALLYKGTTDGFSAETFHQKCDGYTQTYTIVKGSNGNICGGFTDIPWRNESGNGKYLESTRSFVFTLVNSEGIQPTKFDILRPKYAILTHSRLGPTFGAGADLCLSNECNTNTNSYSNLPHTYGGDVASEKFLMGDTNFKVANYEVFCPRESTKASIKNLMTA